jgi:hypothetical protein
MVVWKSVCDTASPWSTHPRQLTPAIRPAANGGPAGLRLGLRLGPRLGLWPPLWIPRTNPEIRTLAVGTQRLFCKSRHAVGN